MEGYPIAAAPSTLAPGAPGGKKNVLLLIGWILAGIGVAGFMLITLIGLLFYHSVYYFNGYDFTKVLCALAILLMLGGIVLTVIGLIQTKPDSTPIKPKVALPVSIPVLVLAVICSAILAINAVTNAISSGSRSSGSSSSYSSYSSSSSYEMDHSTYCLLYMKISGVTVRHSGSYAYITGTITNTGTYQIKYVKVKAVCKNSYGSIIDTDWTYAVDSTWLDPGESKTFEMMVKDSSGSISTADVSVVME